MSVLTTFLVARIDEVGKLVDNAAHADYPLFECRNVGEDDVNDLTEALEEVGLIQPFETGVELVESVEESTGPWIYRFEPHIVNALAALGAGTLPKAAQAWAHATHRRLQREDTLDPSEIEDLQNLLKEMSTLAKVAKTQRAAKQELLLWVAL
jgi:hypothetical protein